MAQIAIRMPKMSMTMTEGELSEWFVSVGDEVSEGDVICEVLTDKVDMEVESPATGVISSIVVESGTVEVGTPIGYIEGDDSGGLGDLLAGIGESSDDSGAEPAAEAPEGDAGAVPAEATSTTTPEPEPELSNQPKAAVPRARAMAREHDVDLDAVVGSGPEGLVLTGDVEAATAADRTPATTGAAPTTAAQVAAAASPPATSPAPTAAAASGKPATGPSDKRVAQIRSRVAAKMTESAAVPQFTLWRDLHLDVPDTRRDGVSWTTVLLASYAAALRTVPELLCRWEDGAAVPAGPPAIGLAVATPHGLLAPVIAEPDRADPHQLDQRVREVVRTAQTGRIDAAYLQLANGMVSNLGSLGVDRFQALVTPPQGSVLSVGAVARRPIAIEGGLGTALTVTVGLTVDHRIGDGAHGARLLQALADIVTQWGEPDSAPGNR